MLSSTITFSKNNLELRLSNIHMGATVIALKAKDGHH